MGYQKKLQISTQQVLVEDNSVFSIQWTDLPTNLCANLNVMDILSFYFRMIRRFTLGAIQPVSQPDGVVFSLLGIVPLICFLPPESRVSSGEESVALRICGGLLVQKDQCDRGEMQISMTQLEEGGRRITLALSDYCPLLLGSSQPSALRRWLYRVTQAAIHQLVTARFLGYLYHKLAGGTKKVVIQHVTVREGIRT